MLDRAITAFDCTVYKLPVIFMLATQQTVHLDQPFIKVILGFKYRFSFHKVHRTICWIKCNKVPYGVQLFCLWIMVHCRQVVIMSARMHSCISFLPTINLYRTDPTIVLYSTYFEIPSCHLISDWWIVNLFQGYYLLAGFNSVLYTIHWLVCRTKSPNIFLFKSCSSWHQTKHKSPTKTIKTESVSIPWHLHVWR